MSSDKKNDDSQSTPGNPVRETVESFAVALILAFLFRAFVAEAFVIPTGSMAPTLMGAHKDIQGAESGFQFQSGASVEFDTETGRPNSTAVVGATCPLTRLEQPMLLKTHWNHWTFSGDRILVSKLSYVFQDPKRWDVIVFKFEGNARQNYIKRCVGLPNETLKIQHGDIFVRPKEKTKFEIARKPVHVVEAMLQPVADSDFVSKAMIDANIPNSWQPSPGIGDGNRGWSAETSNTIFSNPWKVSEDSTQWSATCEPVNSSKDLQWIRYYHRVLSPVQWDALLKNESQPAPIPRYSSRLITDFTPYNASIQTSRDRVYTQKGWLIQDYQSDWTPTQVHDSGFAGYYRPSNPSSSNLQNDGIHWTGDLATEFDIELGSGDGRVVLDLVEAGVHYQCAIDTTNGDANLSATADGAKQAVFESKSSQPVDEVRASTKVRSGSRYRLKFANVDNTLTLWVNGKSVEFSPSNCVVSNVDELLNGHRPQSLPTDPLDAAPIGLGVEGVSAKVSRARVWRDIYYVSDKVSRNSIHAFNDQEDFGFAARIKESLDNNDDATKNFMDTFYPNDSLRKFSNVDALFRDILYSSPTLWNSNPFFNNPHFVEFPLADDEFFPMGDNSAASSDARVWNSRYSIGNALPRRLLIGRAVVVFWPHGWWSPIPFLPNFGRMGLIR